MTLSLLVAVSAALGAPSCKKKAASGGDAGPDAGADDASASLEGGAGGATNASAAADAAAEVPVVVAAAPVARIAPPPPIFAGDYRCFKGMHLDQAGNIVTSTMHTSSTTDTVLACTVGGDTCIGSVREIQTLRGKSPKVTHVKPVTLRRSPNGDLTYKAGAADAKPGAADQTRCPRR